MKKIVIVLTVAVVLVLTSCSVNNQVDDQNKEGAGENADSVQQEDNQVYREEIEEGLIETASMHQIYLSFEEAIDRSYCIVTAKLNSIRNFKNLREYDYTLKETIIGQMDEVNFVVDEGYFESYVDSVNITYSTLNPQYEIGKEYILVLDKISSVYRERDHYMITGDTFIELDGNGNIIDFQRYHQTEHMEPKNVDEFIVFAWAATDPSRERTAYGTPFTRSTEISDIVEASRYIVKAVVEKVDDINPNSNRDKYTCIVTEALRGTTFSKIKIMLFKDTVVVGEEYLFLLNKDTEDSLIYSLSSRSSVLSLTSDKAKVNKVKSLTEDDVHVSVEAEEVSLVVKSTDELIENIYQAIHAYYDNIVYTQNKIRDIKYFYEPAVIVEGYRLLLIEVTEHRIFYYYMPAKLMQGDQPPPFEYNNGIVYAIMRPELGLENPIRQTDDQTILEPDEGYIAFDKKRNILTWTVKRTSMYIRFPETFTDYEEIAGYCKVNIVVIEV